MNIVRDPGAKPRSPTLLFQSIAASAHDDPIRLAVCRRKAMKMAMVSKKPTVSNGL
jgi:hypothetical protein